MYVLSRILFLFHKKLFFFWCSGNNLYIRKEFNEKHTRQCSITDFILAILFISGNRIGIVVWLFNSKIKLIIINIQSRCESGFFFA